MPTYEFRCRTCDDTFELQYAESSGRLFSYPGRYNRTGTEVAFEFDDNAGEWEAVGTFSADDTTLQVKFGLTASLDDFEDGTYVLTASISEPEGPVKEPDEPQDPPPPPEDPPPPSEPECEPECDFMDFFEWNR